MEAATHDHFFRHGQDQIIPPHQRRDCHFCQLRSFSTHKTFPVTIVNETGDGAVLPPWFRFIEYSVLGPGVSRTDDEFRTGCECPEEASCMYAECRCLDELADDEGENANVGSSQSKIDEDAKDEFLAWAESINKKPDWATRKRDGSRDIAVASGSGSGTASRSPALTSVDGIGSNGEATMAMKKKKKKRFAYHSQGAKAGLLRSSKLDSPAPIYECHEGCHCDKALCPNRVVERGRQVPLQIFRTGDGRGWGVKTLKNLKRGQFLDCYLGEVITPTEAESRRHKATKAQRKDVYLFALDKFTNPDSHDPRLQGPPLEVDGEFMSGPTRFINHSCEPNLRIFARVGDHADKHLHDLALFALCDIEKGEELTFDYVNGQEDVERNARDANVQGEMTKCLCGAKKCRGYLW